MNAHAARLLDQLETYRSVPADPLRRLLQQIHRHERTGFGRAHDFANIHTEADYRERVPLMDYEAYREWIGRAAGGEQDVLACSGLTGFERTSGSSGGAKWIPVTDGLREEFARGLATWFGGWKKRAPEVFDGRAYWALSPSGMAPETSGGGLPVGTSDDAAYFPSAVGEALVDWLVVPKLCGVVSEVFRETAEALLACNDLSLVSVWSPTFALALDVELRELRPGFSWRGQWPRLRLVSCWADASSAAWIPRLQAVLDGVEIEPKGLLATEGVTSVPDEINGTPRLADECHYHEFMDESGNVLSPAALRAGQVCEVVLTTGGGLYRYRTGDRVEVQASGGRRRPRLRFSGRCGAVSDLVGEKLSERQVAQALAAAAACGFLQVDPSAPGYVLWLEQTAQGDVVTGWLRRNPYFDQALGLRQLAPVICRSLPERWHQKLASALAVRRGCRLGDVKIPSLMLESTPGEVAEWLGA